jgi:uncharacterized membrane protein
MAFWGSGTCHRILERSYVVAGQVMPLCCRCTGIHLGYFVTIALTFVRGRRRPAILPPPAILVVLFLFLGIVGVDGANSYLALFPNMPNLYEPHHTLRVLTGSLEGIALASFFLPILHMTLWQKPAQEHSIPSWGELGILLLAVILVDLLVLWHPRFLFYPLSLLSLAGLFLSLGMVNTLLVAVIARRANRVTSWKQAITLFLWGCLLAMLEMAAMAWIRYTVVGSYDFSLG